MFFVYDRGQLLSGKDSFEKRESRENEDRGKIEVEDGYS